MSGSEMFLNFLIASMIGAFCVFGMLAFVMLRKKRMAPKGYVPSELDVKAFVLARSLLSDVHSAALADNEKDIYSTDGQRHYDTYEIPFAISAIDKLLQTVEENSKTY